MMSSCMTKLEFLPEPYMLFSLGKLPHLCCLFLHWVLSCFVTLMRHLSCSWNQDHVHTTQICITPTLEVGAKTCFPFRSTQKCFTPTLAVNTKNMFYRFSTKSMLQVLVAITQKFGCRKEAWGYAKVIHEKKRRRLRKNGQVSGISKTMGTHMPAWKKREKRWIR